MDTNENLTLLFSQLKTMQDYFNKNYNVDDIYSNSKIYEFLIANRFHHTAIPGHSGSRDAWDEDHNEIEYKHYKESSSNHTWTFNDFSDTTIEKLYDTPYCYFVYVDDKNYEFPGQIKWYYKVEGSKIAEYLKDATQRITNHRKMINVSRSQLNRLGCSIIELEDFNYKDGSYGAQLSAIIETVQEMEKITGTKGLLTSNKIWELFVAMNLGHNINSEQGGRQGAHDALDAEGNTYEYKVSKSFSWNFQDISDNVLTKYLDDKAMILATVDKTNMKLISIYYALSEDVVPVLREKLKAKIDSYSQRNKDVRRLQVSLSKRDLIRIKAKKIL